MLGADLIRRNQDVHAHMLFSHSHWDHIQGFPFFPPAYNPKTRLEVYGTEEGDEKIYSLLSRQMQDRYFPVQFSDLGAVIGPAHLGGGGKKIGPATVNFHPTEHPGGSMAFSLEANGKKIVYSTDNELDLQLKNREATLANPQLARECPDDFIEFCSDADLLIADGQYTDEEYKTHINWGHPRATTLVDLSKSAKVKQLAITHHDPMQNDEQVDQKIDLCRKRALFVNYEGAIFGAREGITLKI